MLGGQFDSLPPVVSLKMLFFRERVNPLFFDFEDYHKSHLSWIFHWNSSTCSEDVKIFFFSVNYFHQVFWIFWHFLVTKKLMMTSPYNSLHQYFFTLTYFQIDPSPQKKLPSKSPALIGLRHMLQTGKMLRYCKP